MFLTIFFFQQLCKCGLCSNVRHILFFLLRLCFIGAINCCYREQWTPSFSKLNMSYRFTSLKNTQVADLHNRSPTSQPLNTVACVINLASWLSQLKWNVLFWLWECIVSTVRMCSVVSGWYVPTVQVLPVSLYCLYLLGNGCNFLFYICYFMLRHRLKDAGKTKSKFN